MTIQLNRRRIAAFTLIELLVVIAIIALLAAIMFPVFGRVRENARRGSCLSNLKQIGLAFSQYYQDYDEIVPLSSLPAGCTTTGARTWRTSLQPYLKSTQVFRCPSNPKANTDTSSDTDTVSGTIKISYGANANVVFGATNGGGVDCSYRPVGVPPLNIAQIPNASTLIIAGESIDQNSEVVLGRTQAQIQSKTNGPYAGHLATSNYVFADGHAKSLGPLKTLAAGANEFDNMWLWGTPSATSTVDRYSGATTLSTANAWYKTQLGYVESVYAQ